MNAFSASAIVFLGGGLGSLLRHWIGVLFRSQGASNAFPWHTLLINIVGSFALGIFAMQFRERHVLVYLLLSTGLCGGFTTFSAFSLETFEMIQANRILAATGYVSGSVAAALLGVWLGASLLNPPQG